MCLIDSQVGAAKGKLKHFIIEPFVAHKQEEEFYVCIYCERDNDVILFHHEGGVDIGDVDAKVIVLEVCIQTPTNIRLEISRREPGAICI